MEHETATGADERADPSVRPSSPTGDTASAQTVSTTPRTAGEDAEGATMAVADSRDTAGPSSANGPSATADQPHASDASVDPLIVPRTPRFLGDYELLDEVARGGMGIVYRARQVHLNRIVALKIVRDPTLASYTELRRFRSEAEAVALLDHPNIVPIYEVGQIEDQPYFSMKMFEGGNLTTHVERLKDDPRTVARLMAKVGRAVHFAHQRAILHRDIKPSNILLGEDDEPFVADFGLAKQLGPDHCSAQTMTGAVMGTPAYMPPEQARGGTKSVTMAADVYSLGATLYEALTGRPPFVGDSVADILRQVVDEPPARPRTLNARIDRDLETICLKCLEKEPERRYGSAEALVEDLERWLEGRPIAARPVPARERAVKWVRRHRSLAALIAVSAVSLLCLVLGGLGFALWLRAALTTTEDHLYITQIALARRAIDDLLPVVADEILDRQVPDRPWETDRRGFEWYLLRQFAHPMALHGPRSSPDRQMTIRSIAFHPSGGLLASCGDDHTLRTWNLATGMPYAVSAGFGGTTQTVAVSRDGKFIASGGYGKKVTIWTVEPFRVYRELGPLPSVVFDISFSHDSRRVGFLLYDEVRIVDLESGRDARPPIANPANVKPQFVRGRALAFSPDGRWLAMSRDHDVLLYEADTGRYRRAFRGHSAVISSLDFSRDGRRLASSSDDGTIRIWDPGSDADPKVLDGHAGIVNRVVFSPDPDGRTLASATLGRQAQLWDVATGREIRRFPHRSYVQTVAFHPDGSRLATAGGDGVVRIWEISSESTRFVGHRGAAVVDVAVRGDGLQVASIASDSSLGLWTVKTGPAIEPPSLYKLSFKPLSVAYSQDRRHLAVSGDEGTVEVWDTLTCQVVGRIGEKSAVRGMAFSPYGRELATVGMEGSVRIWDWRQRRIDRELPGHAGTVLAVAYSHDGRRLATAGGDKVIRLWDLDTGRVQVLAGHTDFVQSVAFSDDGRFLASAAADQTVIHWALSGWSIASKVLKGHSAPVLDLGFSPDRRRMRIASAGADRTVKLWDPATGLEALTLSEHTDEVTGVAFGPDGEFLVSSSRDGTLRIWKAPRAPGSGAL